MFTAFIVAACQISPVAVPPDPERATEEAILVTAALVPVEAKNAPASATLIDQQRIEALGLTHSSDLIRLSPGVSVSTSGAQGNQTQVRIRGAEANHTLVFIDGIAMNDLAANNEARFETFTAGGLERLELVRGPQSALWGSEALGGVVAMNSPDPLGTLRASFSAEAGSRDSRRVFGALASGGETAGLSGTFSWARSDGIDILGGGAGDLDGFENLTASLKGVVRAGLFEAGAVGRYIHHEVAYDGSDPVTFRRADTAHESTSETEAGRIWVGYGDAEAGAWHARVEAQHLDSENRNRLGPVRTNDSYGRRTRFGARASRRFSLAGSGHQLIAGVEREMEAFGTRDLQFGGSSDRDLERARTAFVGEWRASWGERLITDLAVRHDDFNRFADATTVRAHVELRLLAGLSAVAGYGEGIAQPSFVDLFGFGPGSGFVGNPDLQPERSRGWEGGLRWASEGLFIEAIVFSNDLQNEIVEDFSAYPNYTVVNAPGESRRRGIELFAEWRPRSELRISGSYTHLDARESDAAATDPLREIRRPEHMASLAADWEAGPLTFGTALAYVGERIDSDFDVFPAERVILGDYVLASARIAYRLSDSIEGYARVENGFNARYQDVVGYTTPGRSIHAGIRLRFDR